jgi:hypothetical protein
LAQAIGPSALESSDSAAISLVSNVAEGEPPPLSTYEGLGCVGRGREVAIMNRHERETLKGPRLFVRKIHQGPQHLLPVPKSVVVLVDDCRAHLMLSVVGTRLVLRQEIR